MIEIIDKIKAPLEESGLYHANENGKRHWRLSPEPFLISEEDAKFLTQLGRHLLKFNQAVNTLYFDSIKGRAPRWVAETLDLGKPDPVIELSRMKRFKKHLPGIIRPDILLTEDGPKMTELDSVPGGFGATSLLTELYRDKSWEMLSDDNATIPEMFYQMVATNSGKPSPTIAIVVSDEAEDYRNEMEYLSSLLQKKGHPVYTAHPKDIQFTENGLFLTIEAKTIPIDAIYRFFELFDLKNIPKAELISYSAKKGRVFITPPYKPHLEEKMAFALFSHPALSSFWEKSLGDETFACLSHLIPRTWILDNSPLPAHAVIPGLNLRGQSVQDWNALFDLKQKERELVVKTSGFSPMAWGSRGVTIGHDVSSDNWQKTLEDRLDSFKKEPSILQEFKKSKRFQTRYLDPHSGEMKTMDSRARLTPYYFTVDGQAKLGGALATLCPSDKKKIHGMTDAVMVPVAVGQTSS